MQGAHHVAQKFSTTTWPLSWLSVTEPAEACTVKSGAAVPIRGDRDPLYHPDSARRTKTRAIKRSPVVFEDNSCRDGRPRLSGRARLDLFLIDAGTLRAGLTARTEQIIGCTPL